MSIIRSRFEKVVESNVMNDLVPEVIDEALKDSDIEAVKVTKVDDLHLGEDKSLTFRATVEVRPEINLGNLEDIEGVKEVPEVSDEDINRTLEDFRQRHTVEKPVEREARYSDVIIADVQKLDNTNVPIIGQKTENVRIRLDKENSEVSNLSEKLQGARIGEERNVRVTYADNAPDELRGREESYLVEVKKIIERDVPELTDEFAGEVGDFKKIDELQDHIRRSLERDADYYAERRLEESLVNEIIKNNPFELPPSMIENYLGRLMKSVKEHREEEIDEEEFRLSQRGDAIHTIKRYMVLEVIQKEYGIKATDEEINEQIEMLAAQNNTNPKKLKRRLIDEGRYRAIEEEILDRKTLKFLRSKVHITERKIPYSSKPRILTPR